MNKWVLWLILFGLTSCGPDKTSLTTEEKFSVDTIYNNGLTNWRKTVDSICAAQKDTLYRRAVDSIKKERIEEIELMTK